LHTDRRRDLANSQPPRILAGSADGTSARSVVVTRTGMRMRRSVLLVLLLAVGCGSAGAETAVQTRSGPTSFDGKFAMFWLGDTSTGGMGPNAADGGTIEYPQADTSTLDLYIQDAAVGCAEVQAGQATSNLSTIYVSVNRLGHGTLGPGEYPVIGVPGDDVRETPSAYYIELKGDCLGGKEITDGHLSLSRVTVEAADGSLSIVLRDGTHLDGHFHAERCTNGWTVSPYDPTNATKRYCNP